MLVVDASALVKSLTEPEANAELTALVSTAELHAPTLIGFEVVNATRGLTLGRTIDEDQATQVIRDFEDLAIDQHDLVGSLTALFALRHSFTAYDAAYVVLAKALRAPLVTTDAKMLEAEKFGVEVRVFA